ncbi:11491_t:CDS:2, partial [Acaulospora colombiana]
MKEYCGRAHIHELVGDTMEVRGYGLPNDEYRVTKIPPTLKKHLACKIQKYVIRTTFYGRQVGLGPITKSGTYWYIEGANSKPSRAASSDISLVGVAL